MPLKKKKLKMQDTDWLKKYNTYYNYLTKDL